MRWTEITEQTLTEDQQTVDWSQCALVESVSDRLSGAPVLRGTRMPAQAIVDNYDDGMSPEQISEAFELPVSDVIAILEWRERAYPTR
jgi:uncharacterized protein (DUF433 family)